LYPLGLKSTGMDAIREFLFWDTEGAHTAMKDARDVMNLFELTWQMGPRRRSRLQASLAWKRFRKPMFSSLSSL
jgi:hypothetical protein